MEGQVRCGDARDPPGRSAAERKWAGNRHWGQPRWGKAWRHCGPVPRPLAITPSALSRQWVLASQAGSAGSHTDRGHELPGTAIFQ